MSSLRSREHKGYGLHPSVLDNSRCQPDVRMKLMLPGTYQTLPITGKPAVS